MEALFLGCVERAGADSTEDKTAQDPLLCGTIAPQVWSHQGPAILHIIVQCPVIARVGLFSKSFPVFILLFLFQAVISFVGI
jgi:hypothetical protein